MTNAACSNAPAGMPQDGPTPRPAARCIAAIACCRPPRPGLIAPSTSTWRRRFAHRGHEGARASWENPGRPRKGVFVFELDEHVPRPVPARPRSRRAHRRQTTVVRSKRPFAKPEPGGLSPARATTSIAQSVVTSDNSGGAARLVARAHEDFGIRPAHPEKARQGFSWSRPMEVSDVPFVFQALRKRIERARTVRRSARPVGGLDQRRFAGRCNLHVRARQARRGTRRGLRRLPGPNSATAR